MTFSEHTDDIRTGEAETVFCTVHPQAETNLRCNRCGRPMCSRCAVRTPVGYRCKECVRNQQDQFFDAHVIDYILAGCVSVLMSFFAAMFLSRFGWFFIALFVGPVLGSVIGRVIFTLTKKRRGRYIPRIVGAGVILGALPFLLFNPLSVGLYIVLATGAAAAQFGIRL